MTLANLKLHPHKLHYQVAGLLALAVFAWLRDLTWFARASDTIPVLAALPVLFWLGMPWDKKQPNWTRAEWRVVWAGAICFVLGIVTNLNVLFAAAWAQTFWAIARAGTHADPTRPDDSGDCCRSPFWRFHGLASTASSLDFGFV